MPTIERIVSFLLLYCACNHIPVYCIPLQFEAITEKQGLPVNAILCFAQDSLGFIWIGSDNGLVRFDGYQYQLITKKTTDLNRLLDQTIYIGSSTTLYLSSDGYSDQNNANHDKSGVLAYEKLFAGIAGQSLDE